MVPSQRKNFCVLLLPFKEEVGYFESADSRYIECMQRESQMWMEVETSALNLFSFRASALLACGWPACSISIETRSSSFQQTYLYELSSHKVVPHTLWGRGQPFGAKRRGEGLLMAKAQWLPLLLAGLGSPRNCNSKFFRVNCQCSIQVPSGPDFSNRSSPPPLTPPPPCTSFWSVNGLEW